MPALVRLSSGMALVVLAMMLAVPARAQTTASVSAMHEELAKSLFAEGVTLTEDGRWGDAAERFSRSLQLYPRSRTALNLSVALMRAGRPVQALEALDRYRALASDVPGEELERSARLREQIESMTAHLSLEVFPIETDLAVDQRALPHQPKQWLVLDPGRHDVEAVYRGQRRAFTVELKAGERVTHEIRWPDAAVVDLPSPSEAARSLPIDEPVATPAQAPSRQWKRWVWIGSAVLVAAGAAAITTWAVRRDARSTSSSCPDEEVCLPNSSGVMLQALQR